MQNFGAITALLLIAFLGAVLALKKIIRTNALAPKSCLVLIIGFAALFRISLVTQTPWLSNDVYRYLWDARVLEHGINPYKYPPEANELLQLRDDELFAKMSHKDVRTVYPPVLQGLFWLGAKFGQVFDVHPNSALKSLFVFFDLLLLLVLMRTLLQLHLDPRWVLFYAWHPLAVIEIASSGHTDGLGAFFLAAALLFLVRERHVPGAIFLAFAFLVKFVSALLLPFVFFFARRRGVKRYHWPAVLAFLATILVCYLPFIPAGENLFSGLSVYSEKWRFNDAAFSLFFTPLHALLPDRVVALLMIPQGWEITVETLRTRRVDLALLLTKLVTAAIFVIFYWRLWQSTRDEQATSGSVHWPRITLAILAAFFLLSPTLQPWYLLWILPLLVLSFGKARIRLNENQLPNRSTNIDNAVSKFSRGDCLLSKRFKIFLWMLSGTVLLSYWVLYDYWREGVWQEQAWVKWIEYALPGVIFFLPVKYWWHGKED